MKIEEYLFKKSRAKKPELIEIFEWVIKALINDKMSQIFIMFRVKIRYHLLSTTNFPIFPNWVATHMKCSLALRFSSHQQQKRVSKEEFSSAVSNIFTTQSLVFIELNDFEHVEPNRIKIKENLNCKKLLSRRGEKKLWS